MRLTGQILGTAALLLCFSPNLSAQESRTRRSESRTTIQQAPKSPVSDPSPTNQESIDVIKVDSNLVSVPVIVSDREGRYVPNLTLEQFKLFDNDVEQKIAYFDAAAEPLNVALLLDTSRSTEGVLDDIKKAAKDFLKELRPQDNAIVVSFDYAVHELCSLTNDRKVLEKAINEAKVGKNYGTTLNDAVDSIANKVFRTVSGRKAIILLSDGQDFGSIIPRDTLLDQESESDTMVYSIFYESSPAGIFQGRRRSFPGRSPRQGGIFERPDDWNLPNQQGRRSQIRYLRNERGAEFLRTLSETTSGRFYRSGLTDLKQTFSLISEELRHQYRLGFYPVEMQKDGKIHQLRVKVDLSDVAVRARQQYRAQEEQ